MGQQVDSNVGDTNTGMSSAGEGPGREGKTEVGQNNHTFFRIDAIMVEQ